MIKALTFGTGIFLRGFFCDFAERAGISVLMSSSTLEGDHRAAALNAVDGKFVLAYRGKVNEGVLIDTWRTVSAVQHVFPSMEWADVLALSSDPDCSLLVSNVSEAGFRRAPDPADDRPEHPRSFPARLTRWLFERWNRLGPSAQVTVLPCELFAENGAKLTGMLAEVAEEWRLPDEFFPYLAAVRIPDTLVDRIVTGEPSDAERGTVWRERLGNEVALPIVIAEPFALWAIRGDNALANILSPLIAAGEGKIVVANDISDFVLKKVRFLNGLHSAMATLGTVEYQVTTVREAVEHPELGLLLRSALFEEILPAVAPPVDTAEAYAYAETTWARFANPFLEHKLADINKGAAAKWPVRLHPTIAAYRARFGKEPPVLSRCKAAFDRLPAN